jgi:hypothetical protein
VYVNVSSPCGAGSGQSCGNATQTLYQSSSNCTSNTQDWNGLWYGMSCFGYCHDVCYSGRFYSVGSCSDSRIKKNVKTLDNTLEKIMNFEVVEFDWNEKLNKSDYTYYLSKNKIHSVGLIAQNIKEYYPEVIGLTNGNYYKIEYPKLNAVLVQGIKEQQVFIEDIESQISELKKIIN